MSDIQVILQGWADKRNTISELTLYAEDEQHRVVKSAILPPETTDTRLDLPAGRFKIYTLFVSMPYRWYKGADPIELPCTSPVVLDLDQATVDEVLVPPP